MKEGAMMNKKLWKIGEESWELFLFTKKFFVELLKPPFELSETVKQSFSIGYKSLGLVSITGSIIGLTLALQLIPTLAKFGAESLIPSMLSIAILREIGPVIISLICAGKMGSAIGAELGSMKVTEQISAMEVSAVNPFKYLVVTRVIATTLTVPILVIYSNALSLLGGYFALSITSNIGIQLYFDSAISILGFADIIPSTIKTAFFGFSIGIVGCYKGYNCSRGTESVGLAANSSVVLASLFVIIIDLIAVQISSLLFS